MYINVFREELAANNWDTVYNSKEVNTAYLNFQKLLIKSSSESC